MTSYIENNDGSGLDPRRGRIICGSPNADMNNVENFMREDALARAHAVISAYEGGKIGEHIKVTTGSHGCYVTEYVMVDAKEYSKAFTLRMAFEIAEELS